MQVIHVSSIKLRIIHGTVPCYLQRENWFLTNWNTSSSIN